jgi:catechol 2,3-dioxygenase-like lactoylglutathione lyase family enzyme
MKPALTHIWLLVDDMPRAVQFYREALGLEVTSDLGQYVELNASEQFELALFTHAAMRAGEPDIAITPAAGQRAVLSFEVGAVDEWADALRAKGVSLTSEPANHPEWGLRTIFLQDPDGNLICLYSGIPEVAPA